MIKNYLTLVAVLFSLSLFAQDVPEVQKSMITKSTATWCPNCGTWGWSLFLGLIEDNDDNALVIASHFSGDLQNPTAIALIDNFNSSSQPRFLLGNTDQGVSNSNWSSKRTAIAADVAAAAAMSPVANAGLTVILNNDNVLEITTKTMFFQEATGEYNIAAYIIENDVIATQASIGSMAEHKNILRASASADAFGELLSNGTIAAGTAFDQNFTIPVNSDWVVENLEVALVIWKKDANGDWEFVNTNETSQFDAPVIDAVAEIAATDLTMNIQPTIASSNTTLVLEVVKDQSDLEITIVNQLGQVQSTVLAGKVSAGTQTIEIGNDLSNGVYFAVARIGNQVLTQRFILQ